MTSKEDLAEQNQRSLRKMYPEYADVLSAVPDSSAYSFESIDGTVLCHDAQGRCLHGPEDRLKAHAEAARVVEEDAGLYIVLRPGLGYQAFAILEMVEKRSPRSLVVVVEDRLDLLRMAFALTDWTPVYHGESAVLLVGSPDVVIEAFLERHPKLCLLPVTLVSQNASG